MRQPILIAALLALLPLACSDLFEPDARPDGPVGQGNVAIRLHFDVAGNDPLDLSRVPLLSRVRLLVDMPESHRADGGQALGLIDVDLPLDIAEQVVDVPEGDDRVFLAAAYRAGRREPVYTGTAIEDIAADDGSGDPQVVMVSLAPVEDDADLPPRVGIEADLETLAGNQVTARAAAADLELGALTLKWQVSLGGEPQELGQADNGDLVVRPPTPGAYLIEVKALVVDIESEPAYARLDALRCDEAPDGVQCDEGLDCAPNGVCLDPQDIEEVSAGAEADAEADGG